MTSVNHTRAPKATIILHAYIFLTNPRKPAQIPTFAHKTSRKFGLNDGLARYLARDRSSRYQIFANEVAADRRNEASPIHSPDYASRSASWIGNGSATMVRMMSSFSPSMRSAIAAIRLGASASGRSPSTSAMIMNNIAPPTA